MGSLLPAINAADTEGPSASACHNNNNNNNNNTDAHRKVKGFGAIPVWHVEAPEQRSAAHVNSNEHKGVGKVRELPRWDEESERKK